MAKIHTLNVIGDKNDQFISRWLDGDLTDAERQQFSDRLADEPALHRRLVEFQYHDALLCELLADDKFSVNPALAARLAAPAKAPVATDRTIWALAASALLAMGLVFQLGNSALTVESQMSYDLADALESQPSRAQGWDELKNGAQMRAVLSFPSAQGTWCREFLLAQDSNHWRGVACRHQDSWVTQILARDLFLESGEGYRLAGAQDVDSVARFIDQQAVDVALSSQQELAVIASNWMPISPSE